MNKQIIELSHHNVFVNRAVSSYLAGCCTWEEAMEELVIVLCNANEATTAALESYMVSSVSPVVIKVHENGDIERSEYMYPLR